MALGDSKTAPPNWWPDLLGASVSAARGTEVTVYNFGVGGTTAGNFNLAPTFAGLSHLPSTTPVVFLVDFGVNNIQTGGTASMSLYSEQLVSFVNNVRARFPHAIFYLTKVWRSTLPPNYPDPTITNTLAAMAAEVDAIVAARPAYVFVGDDERTWLSAHASDGVHVNQTTAAQEAARDQKLAFLGY